MSKNLKEEQEKYTSFLEDFQKLSEGEKNEFKKSGLEDSKRIIQEYSKDLSYESFKNLVNDWEAATPEEVETIKLCWAV